MLEGKGALITGSTKNNGYGMAKLFSPLGATVFVNGQAESEVEAAVGSLEAETGGTFHPAPADVSLHRKQRCG